MIRVPNPWSSDSAGTSIFGAIWVIVVLVAMLILFPVIYGNLMESAERRDPEPDRPSTSSPADHSTPTP